MSTPFGRMLGRIAELVRAPSTAAIERHVLAAARIKPGERVLVIGEGPDVGARAGSAEHTGKAGESVDVVISFGDAPSWHDRAAAFAELHRVLKPGGRL